SRLDYIVRDGVCLRGAVPLMLDVTQHDQNGETGPDSLSLGFIEDLYASYLRDPTSVSADWRRYFRQLTNGDGKPAAVSSGPSFRPPSVCNPGPPADDASLRGLEMALLQDRVDQLVRSYRVRGHMVANIDPLGMPRPYVPELDPETYGFTAADLDRPFSTA